MRHTPMCLTAVFASLAFAASAHANLLVNGSLESSLNRGNVQQASLTKNSNILNGWTLTSGTITVVNKKYWQAENGNYSVDLIGDYGPATLEQTLTGLTPGDTYTLTFDFACNPNHTKGKDEFKTTKVLEVSAIGGDGETVLESDTYSTANAGRTRKNMQYSHEIFTFTADDTTATLVLAAQPSQNLPRGLVASRTRVGPVVDNLDLELTSSSATPAPEPASLAVLGLGGVALLARRRGRR